MRTTSDRLPLRVCFIDQQGNEAGGAENSLELLLTHLPPTIEPSAVLFSDGAFADRLRRHHIPVDVLALPAEFTATTREAPSLRAALHVPQASWQLAKCLRSKDLDIIYTNTIKAHIVGGLAALLSGYPTVHHFRDILHGKSRLLVSATARIVSKKRIAISERVNRCYRLPDTFVVPNPLALARYETLPERSLARRALGLPIGIPIVAIIGRINRWKGQDRFIRAAAMIASQVPSHFVVAGSPRFRDSDFLPELHSLVDSLGLRSRITFLDWLDDPTDLYASIDVNVNCSTEEPFGRTVIEAAAAGIPTVCFNDSGCR